jgi:PTH1 family peptidyl-tRNA hydrolase
VIEGQKVMLAQPQTFMNLSGESVRALMDFYKLDLEDLVVIYDDISLPVGQVRIRPKGSAGGHNGIKNIIQHLGTQEFARIKIGVGAKPEGGDLIRHVLGRFSKEEDAHVREVFALAEKGLLAILQEDVASAMNQVNGIRLGE